LTGADDRGFVQRLFDMAVESGARGARGWLGPPVVVTTACPSSGGSSPV